MQQVIAALLPPCNTKAGPRAITITHTLYINAIAVSALAGCTMQTVAHEY
jgi:transposase